MVKDYWICDVFTSRQFGGNPLLVLPDASGLSTDQMHDIAREFHFSEATFVTPAEHEGTHRVRIFTPTREIPFAGHPNIGTALVLAHIGDAKDFLFEEGAGNVPVERSKNNRYTLQAPEPLVIGREAPTTLLAEALCLRPEDICTTTHRPCEASVGLPFTFVELTDRDTLARAKVGHRAFEQLHELGVAADVMLYCRSTDQRICHTRMFAPLDGIDEDPATGSASGALVGLLGFYGVIAEHKPWVFRQGEDMGRASEIHVSAAKHQGGEWCATVSGNGVIVSHGKLFLGDSPAG